MSKKNFKTIDEQYAILVSRGLKLGKLTEDEVKEKLLYNNYYRLSGYSLTIRNNDIFDADATFDKFFEIYDCDTEMRSILFKALQNVECRIKSLFAYSYAKITQNPYDYKNIDNYDITPYNMSATDKDYAKRAAERYNKYYHIIQKVDKVKAQDEENELYLKHYKTKYNDELPIWIYVELMTFSDISQLFNLLQKLIKQDLVNYMKYSKISLLSNHLYCCSLLRNFCAHGHRLYNRVFSTKPNLPAKYKNRLLSINQTVVDYKLYSYYLVLQQILIPKDFNILTNSIDNLFKKYSLINIEEYGFPKNWK